LRQAVVFAIEPASSFEGDLHLTATPIDSPREPIFNLTPVVLGLIGVFVAIQVMREVMGEASDLFVLTQLAFVPARLTQFFDPAAVKRELFADLSVGDPAALEQAQLARQLIGDGAVKIWTLVTYAFVHGDWVHLTINSVWLLAFGAAVERRFGAARFAIFFMVTAVAGALAHYLTHRFDWLPMVGASAAVSGAMAAATRFVFQPGGPLGEGADLWRRDGDAAFRKPALRLAEIFADRRAMTFLGIWFVLNYLSGTGAVAFGAQEASIAWQAHIGGFLVGLFLFPWFDRSHGPA
jgi:membrane associated rhomboid family serine protease